MRSFLVWRVPTFRTANLVVIVWLVLIPPSLVASAQTQAVVEEGPERAVQLAGSRVREPGLLSVGTIARERVEVASSFPSDPIGLSSLRVDVLGLRIVADRETSHRNGSGSTSWSGKVRGDETGSVTLVVRDGHVGGTMRTEGRVILFQATGSGEFVAREIQPEILKEGCDAPGQLAAFAPLDQEPEAASRGALRGSAVTLDLLVLYTSGAKAEAGSRTNMENAIEVAVAEINRSYRDSGIDHSVMLAGMDEVAYEEAGDLEADVDWLRSDPGVLGRLDANSADLVALIVEDGAPNAGIATTLAVPQGDSNRAFSVVEFDNMTGTYTLNHEVGHLLGAGHAHNVTSNRLFSYSHGHIDSSATRGTVMATACNSCQRLNLWSDPDATWPGTTEPRGVPAGQVDPADNRRTLDYSAPLVADYRSRPTNGGFEEDRVTWASSGDFQISGDFPSQAHAGTHYAYLAGPTGAPGNNLDGALLSARFAVPGNAESATLEMWNRVTTIETTTTTDYDFLRAYLVEPGDVLTEISEFALTNRSPLDSWRLLSWTLPARLHGQIVQVFFVAETDGSLPTTFRIDDVSLNVQSSGDGECTAGAPSVTTLSAVGVTSTSMRLRSEVSSCKDFTYWWDFEAGDSTPNDDTVIGSASGGPGPQTLELLVDDLACDTLYYFEGKVRDVDGETETGSTLSARTEPCGCQGEPETVTLPAINVTRDSLTLRAEVTSCRDFSYYWDFEEGDATPNDDTVTGERSGSESPQVVSLDVSSLACGKTYYFESHVVDVAGEDGLGQTLSADTLACEDVGEGPADLAPDLPEINRTQPPVGGSILITARVRNLGAEASPATTVNFYVSSDPAISEADALLGQESVRALDPQGATTRYLSTYAPAEDGEFWIGVCVESVAGEEKLDNQCSAGVRIEVGEGSATIFADGFESGNVSGWSG